MNEDTRFSCNDLSNQYESQEYMDFVLEKANENARLIKEQAEKEIDGILGIIQLLDDEYKNEASLIDERIEEKKNIIARLNSLIVLVDEDTSRLKSLSGKTAENGQADELYKNIKNQMKKLSILAIAFNDLLNKKEKLLI